MKKGRIVLIISLILMSFSSILSAAAVSSYLYNANEVSYDNNSSGIGYTDVQGAIDELYEQATYYASMNSRVSTLESYFNDNTSEINIVGNPVKINGKDMTDIGAVFSKDSSSTSIASGSGYKSLGNFQLPSAGTWIVNVHFAFGASDTGYRLGSVFIDSGLTTAPNNLAAASGPAVTSTSGTTAVLKSTFIVQPTAAKTYYVGVQHNAGAALSCYFRVRAIKVI